MATMAAIEWAGASLGDHALAALRCEFGAVLASRILEAEAADFHWRARIAERYVGQYLDDGLGSGDPYQELSRVAILSRLDGYDHVAMGLIDGDGEIEALLWLRSYAGRAEAAEAFRLAR